MPPTGPIFCASVPGKPRMYAPRCEHSKWPAAERAEASREIYINIDDSLGEKDQDTRHLEPVDWHFAHSESTKSKLRYKNAFCYVVCTLRVGQNLATADLQLYLRERTVRRLNRKRSKAERIPFRKIDQVCPSPTLARHLRSQVQPQTRWQTHRPTRSDIQAPVVHTGSCDHYGREQTNLLCATARWPFSRSSRQRPCLLLEKAPQGEIPGVHCMYGSHLLVKTGLARIYLAVVMRNCQLLHQDPDWARRFSGAVLHSGGQIHRRRSFGLGLRRATFCSGTFCPNQDFRRHHSAASGRTRHRLVDGSYPNGCRNRRCRKGTPAFLAFGITACIIPSVSQRVDRFGTSHHGQ